MFGCADFAEPTDRSINNSNYSIRNHGHKPTCIKPAGDDEMMAYTNTTRDQAGNQTRMAPFLVPTTQFNILAIGYFQQGGQGHGGGRHGGGRGGRETALGQSSHCNRMPYVNTGATQNFFDRGSDRGVPPFVPVPGPEGYAWNAALAYSNIVKRYNNMNYCFSHGFDVKDWHTSKTCRYKQRHANHQEVASRSNAQQYIDAGYNACTKAKHKLIHLKTSTVWGGAISRSL
jgi:hypothetical protein